MHFNRETARAILDAIVLPGAGKRFADMYVHRVTPKGREFLADVGAGR